MAATTVSIKNLDKAELLVRLWEGAKSWRGLPSPIRMSLNEPLKISRRELLEGAQRIVGGGRSVYVWHGRFIVVDIAKDEIDTSIYNKRNGEGAAERIIAQMRAEQ